MAETLLRRLVHVFGVLPPLLLTSCVHQRPSDLQLELVYVADLSSTLGYKHEVAMGLLPQPLRLAIELSSTEMFPGGASVVDGFCGEKQGPGYLGNGTLYRVNDPNVASSGLARHDQPDRNRYLVLVDIVYKPARPSPELANFDLRDDARDICLTTGSGTYADVWQSNGVRVPRRLIERALHAPPHTDVPLGPKQLP